MGTNDLAKELRSPIVPGRHPLVPHLATALLAAREAGKVDHRRRLQRREGPRRLRSPSAVQGMEMGFDGKTLIHPSQVEPANEIWAPSAEEIEYAERVIAAFDEAVADGQGRRHRRRSNDREPPRRQRPPRAGRRRGDRRRDRMTWRCRARFGAGRRTEHDEHGRPHRRVRCRLDRVCYPFARRSRIDVVPGRKA